MYASPAGEVKDIAWHTLYSKVWCGSCQNLKVLLAADREIRLGWLEVEAEEAAGQSLIGNAHLSHLNWQQLFRSL